MGLGVLRGPLDGRPVGFLGLLQSAEPRQGLGQSEGDVCTARCVLGRVAEGLRGLIIPAQVGVRIAQGNPGIDEIGGQADGPLIGRDGLLYPPHVHERLAP